MNWYECKHHGLVEATDPKCNKCMPVGMCSVCEGPVDESESAKCYICKKVFCYPHCGGWGSHDTICDNCTKKD